jgi:hypothetical protein
MFIAALAINRHWATEREEADALKQQAIAAQKVRPVPVRLPELSVAGRRLQQVRAELSRPWLATLSAIESATVHPVYLLALSIEPASGVVSFEAEAPSFDRALSYVEALSASGALVQVSLVSHAQATAQPSDLPVVRFTATGQWNLR